MPGVPHACRWCFTINHYTPQEVQMVIGLINGAECYLGCAEYEVAADGTPHIQAYVHLNHKLYRNQILCRAFPAPIMHDGVRRSPFEQVSSQNGSEDNKLMSSDRSNGRRMTQFELVFQGKTFPVPRKSVWEFLDNRRDLLDTKSYEVQSAVSPGVFEAFLNSLRTQTKIAITKENVDSLSLLADEFALADLASDCAAFSVQSVSELSDRVSRLEAQISVLLPDSIRFGEQFSAHEREFARLASLISMLRTDISSIRTQVSSIQGNDQGKVLSSAICSLQTGLSSLRFACDRDFRAIRSDLGAEIATLRVDCLRSQIESPPISAPFPDFAGSESRSRIEVPMKWAGSVDGIVSYLTNKFGGNVHEQGIVRITSKSADHRPEHALKNVANVSSSSFFVSKNEPSQWICWDFGRMRICPTHYTIRTKYLKSWVVASSVSGRTWTGIDRRDGNDFDMDLPRAASFTLSKPLEARFIRLTQTDKNHFPDDHLRLQALEFFGTLFE
jgi:hypothetical protein